MKKIRSYTSIWNVEKIMYAIGDIELLIPMTVTQIKLFVVFFFLFLMFGKMPPLNLIENALIKNLVLPGLLTYAFSQKAFDGKKPFGFIKSVLLYFARPKVTYAGKGVKLSKSYKFNESMTAVRSEIYVPD
ncbi:conjugal transfer protein [Scatolibacter rhodanostii]|uniref:conjugal transfer protein n=1 Tax=Scatolibacter rhodanostii TaxID=2014781 RepID=UPI000C08328D|nr:conjugal transfer protein [Scatolibacter rhodanostii]